VLFSLIGTTYGGDGRMTFALPEASPIPTKNGPPLMQCIAITGSMPLRSRSRVPFARAKTS